MELHHWVLMGLCLVLTVPAAAQPDRHCRAIATPETIGLTNGNVTLAFDRRTGALLQLRNDARSDEYLKERLPEGNPFRVYVDTTEPPAPVVDPNWWSGKIEGAMGGRTVDAGQCRVTGSTFRRYGAGGVLILELTDEGTGLAFRLTVRLPDGSDAADCDLTVRNDAREAHTVLTAFPHLTGLQLGATRETNRGLMLAFYGTPGVRAWMDSGGLYGREVSMQWQAVYEPALDEGFGFLVMDPALQPKLIRRFAPSGMSALYLPALRLEPGQAHRYPTARLLVHQGNWRVVARRYGDWYRKHFKPRRPPSWLRTIDLFVGPWIPSAAEVATAKTRPDGAGFTSYRQMPLLYLNDPYDLKEWAQYNEGVFTNPATYGAYMADGTYHFRSDLGGAEAMREGVARLHRMGRRIMFYVAGNSVLRDSEVLKGTRPEDWMLMDRPGHMYDIGYPNGISVCPGYGPWQDHLARTCRRILAETGADGIRLDELASFVPCYNPAHHHASPLDSNQWLRELTRKVRAAMDEVNPDTILNTEGPADYLHELCDAALQMFQPGRDIDAMRVALPSYVGFAYHPGAVELALNGWVGGKTTARRVEWPWAHRGLAGRPDYYAPGPGPETRWHELRATFPEAVVDGQPTLADPEAEGDPHWAGRLWAGKRYWLLVGGHEDGSPLSGKICVRLPELPATVRHAYEFDAQTLAMRDAVLEREDGRAFVTVASGLGAVLLPRPDCPPLLQIDGLPQRIAPGEQVHFSVSAFAPWRPDAARIRATMAFPGVHAKPLPLSAPCEVRFTALPDADPGLYPLTITGDVLPLKRWVRVGR